MSSGVWDECKDRGDDGDDENNNNNNRKYRVHRVSNNTLISLREWFVFILTIPKDRHHFAFQETEAQRDGIIDLPWNTYQVVEPGL